MRVKIVQAGWENYNGPLYGVMFVESVGQADLSRGDALSLGAFVSIVEIDEDGNDVGVVSPTHEIVLGRDVSAEVVVPMARDFVEPEAEPEAELIVIADVTMEDTIQALDELSGEDAPEVVPAEVAHVYTEAELVVIADEKGITGLREIGTPLGVRNTSISGLIREILAAQGAN